jgi:hypothetical protein
MTLIGITPDMLDFFDLKEVGHFQDVVSVSGAQDLQMGHLVRLDLSA